MTKESQTVSLIRPDTPQLWARRINRRLGEAVAAIIATGHALLGAKRALPHGQWERLFVGHPEAVADPVRFSIGTAERLMAIAKHPILTKSAHGPLLPPSWRTLYELTKVPTPLLRRALAEGQVHPALERRAVRALYATAAGAATGPPLSAVRSAAENCLFEVLARVRATIGDLAVHERTILIAQLRALCDQLDAETAAGEEG
jgi:hypothetical protein